MPKSLRGLPLKLGESTLRPIVGVRVDFDLCIPAGLLGRDPTESKLPVDVADFNLCTVGFSGTGLGIFDNHGKSGEGGAWILGDGLGPATMPSATCLMSRLHLSQRLSLVVGCSVSGVVKGLPWAGRFLLTNGKTMAEVEAVLVSTAWPPVLASLVGTLILTSASVLVPWCLV